MGSVVDVNDFENNALADNGVVVKHYVSTIVTKSNGDEVLTFDSGTDIDAIFHLNKNDFKQDKEGDVIQSDGYIMVGPSINIKKNDVIEYDSRRYILFNVRERGPSGDIIFYKYAHINLYNDTP